MLCKDKINIHQFAYTIGKTVPTVRHLIYNGNMFGTLPATQDENKMWMIDKEQLYIFPFVEPGYHKCPKVFHYTEGKGLTYCEKCTLHLRCDRLDDEGHWNGKE
jgi:hypothetical protein